MSIITCHAEFIARWTDVDTMLPIDGDIATMCYHKGTLFIAFGDCHIEGRRYTNVLGIVQGDPKLGIVKIVNLNYSEKIYPYSTVPQKFLSVGDRLYAYLIHVRAWPSSVNPITNDQMEARGVLNDSDDDGITFREINKFRINGNYVNSVPVVDPNISDNVWMFYTKAYRRGGVYLSVGDIHRLGDPTGYFRGSPRPILPFNTSDFSVIFDKYSEKWLFIGWHFRNGSNQKLVSCYADRPDGKWSNPVVLWEREAFADWMQMETPDLTDLMADRVKLKAKLDLLRGDKKAEAIIAWEEGGQAALEQVFAVPWGSPYCWEMIPELNDDKYIYGNASLFVPYSPFLVRFDRHDIF